MGPKTLRAIGLDGASMSFIGLYARVLGRLGPEKWLAAGLVVANVALAVSQFAEPMLFGKIIDYLTRSMNPGNGLQWSGIGPWLAAWAGFGIFSIVASVTVALNSDRLAHRRRVVEMAAYFDHVLHLPMSFHAHAHTGRLLKIMIEGASGMFGVWLSFFREHFAALVALGVLLPATLVVNWRLGGILLILVVVLGILMNVVLRKTEVMQSAADVYSNDVAERVSDVLGNMPAIQSFARADEETSALTRMIDRMLNAQMPVLTWWALASVATRSSSTLALVSILVTGVWIDDAEPDDGRADRRLHVARPDAGRAARADGRLRQLHAEPVAAHPDVLRRDGHEARRRRRAGRGRGRAARRPRAVRGRVVRLRQGARGALRRQFRRRRPARRSRSSARPDRASRRRSTCCIGCSTRPRAE